MPPGPSRAPQPALHLAQQFVSVVTRLERFSVRSVAQTGALASNDNSTPQPLPLFTSTIIKPSSSVANMWVELPEVGIGHGLDLAKPAAVMFTGRGEISSTLLVMRVKIVVPSSVTPARNLALDNHPNICPFRYTFLCLLVHRNKQ